MSARWPSNLGSLVMQGRRGLLDGEGGRQGIYAAMVSRRTTKSAKNIFFLGGGYQVLFFYLIVFEH